MPNSLDVKLYENAVSMSEKLYDMLSQSYGYKFTKRYVQSFMNYLRLSDFGQLWIDFLVDKTMVSVLISSYCGCNQDRPYFFSAYKHRKGDYDINDDYELQIYLKNTSNQTSIDFELIKNKLDKFLGIKQKYEQLTLF